MANLINIINTAASHMVKLAEDDYDVNQGKLDAAIAASEKEYENKQRLIGGVAGAAGLGGAAYLLAKLLKKKRALAYALGGAAIGGAAGAFGTPAAMAALGKYKDNRRHAEERKKYEDELDRQQRLEVRTALDEVSGPPMDARPLSDAQKNQIKAWDDEKAKASAMEKDMAAGRQMVEREQRIKQLWRELQTLISSTEQAGPAGLHSPVTPGKSGLNAPASKAEALEQGWQNALKRFNK